MPAKPTKFVEEPQALICPVCKKIFREPVISIKCGHTFCRICIEEMIRNGLTCPMDEQECDSGQLVLNRAVIGQIDDLQIYCSHGLVSNDGGERTSKTLWGVRRSFGLAGGRNTRASASLPRFGIGYW